MNLQQNDQGAGRPAPRVAALLASIYGEAAATSVLPGFTELLDRHPGRGARTRPAPKGWLIAYPDHVSAPQVPPLASLQHLLTRHLPSFGGVHILPCFPSTSDEGFAVSDYLSIDPSFGSWSDIETLAATHDVMLDAVVNHTSSSARWFEGWKSGAKRYASFYRTEDPTTDLSGVVRARQHPLLTEFPTARGSKWVWTTFSNDQVDLDYRNPFVALAIIDVLLTYASHGANAIRLDAVGFLWKQPGTASIHLRETHLLVQLMRACLDATYPHVVLISETNVPHEENISYLGSEGEPEADLVYQFPLPPLTLHAYTTGDATALETWLRSLSPTPPGTTFFNFLSSHDGVGLRPIEGLVPNADVELLVDACVGNGGRVNYRTGATGDDVAYELTATWFDLIRGPVTGDDALARHISSHGFMCGLVGQPAVYLQSVLAERNAVNLAERTGVARSINRRRFRFDDIAARLTDPTSAAARSASAIQEILEWRSESRAFDPTSAQSVVDTPDGLVGIERRSPDGEVARVIANVTGQPISAPAPTGRLRGFRVVADEETMTVGPWGLAWIDRSG